MKYIEAYFTVHKFQESRLETIFSSLQITHSKKEYIIADNTVTFSLDNIVSENEERLVTIYELLRHHELSFSLVWSSTKCSCSGEVHFRSNGIEQQFLAWNNKEKNRVNTEDVRQMLNEGGSALIELVEMIEEKYLPWDWKRIAF